MSKYLVERLRRGQERQRSNDYSFEYLFSGSNFDIAIDEAIAYINSTASRDKVLLPDGVSLSIDKNGVISIHTEGEIPAYVHGNSPAYDLLAKLLKSAPNTKEAPQPEKSPMIDPDMRDMFATSALIGMLAHEGPMMKYIDSATAAYMMADAMLAARQGEK